RMISDAPSAERVRADAARLFDDLAADLSIEDLDAFPISIEDILLVDPFVARRPPPLPEQLRVRPQGTGPVSFVKKES
ncbi:MAG: hypothetical protein H0V17_12325, partial [Deltaproteobacteria bacterium]|nr:hypothetical protein [Deltaproteobacteria bacterium]